MKKCLTLLVLWALLISCVMPAFAATGNVTYSGDAGEFIFTPGSDYSPTDLFPNFKEVMPGDTLMQPITVKNKASNKVKIKVYMRALGAHPDSEEFLSQLQLRVEKATLNEMPYMFDAAASETAQLTEWVLLGTLYSGGKIDLEVLLDVPTTLGNDYQDQIGYLDWEFKIEQLPIEPTDPEPPKTGDNTQIWLWGALMGASFCGLVLLALLRKRKKKEA